MKSAWDIGLAQTNYCFLLHRHSRSFWPIHACSKC